MNYKVLIPTAGIGSRLGGRTQYFNKSLVSIGYRPAITRIIDHFPEPVEFVIPTGYKGELVREFLTLAYPHRMFHFTDVDPYEGKGSGLGWSILSGKEYLQEPFVFCSCDTLVTDPIPEPNRNWMGYGEREELSAYRTIQIEKGRVTGIQEKGDIPPGAKPYIGLAGIFDYQTFWRKMEDHQNHSIPEGEVYGLKKLLSSQVDAIPFTWYDTGVEGELERTQTHFQREDAPNILEKADETIWFLDKEVIKYSGNPSFIADRVKRAELLKGFIPEVTKSSTHLYAYRYAEGKVLSKEITIPIFQKFLEFSQSFWEKKIFSTQESKKFQERCLKFYKNKTEQRVQLFYQNFEKQDREESINGIPMPTLRKMLDTLDWKWISKGMPGRFHGDYHFENILYEKETQQFCLLDWRQNFEGSLEIGDIYYDLGKLLHGLLVCHDLIAKDAYAVEWEEGELHFDVCRKQSLVECESYFYAWLNENGYDVRKVKVITALIFLNIAALHHHPYGLLLYALGKKMLFENRLYGKEEWHGKKENC